MLGGRGTLRKSPAEELPGLADVVQLAGRPEVQSLLRWFGRERKWIDEKHLAVCRIAAPTFFEQARAEWVAAELKALGWDSQVDRAGNVVALPKGTPASAPLVAICAHLDTVLAPRTPEDIRGEGRGRFEGPGVSDNGAGLAALLALARALREEPPTFASQEDAGFVLVANVGEEGDGNLSGMRYLCRQSPLAPRIRSFLVLDGPATEHVTTDALACRRFEVSVHGPGGHSWSDHGTANAVHALARAISLFLDARAEAPPELPCSFNFGVIDGGSTVNSIPASARCKVDLRSPDPETLDMLSASLTAALERALLIENERSMAGRVSGKLKETGSRPGGRLAEDSPLRRFIQAVDAHLGIHSRPDCASTDANVPFSMGLPALSIGAGGSGGGAHTAAEWYDPAGRDLGLRRILLLALLMLEAAGRDR